MKEPSYVEIYKKYRPKQWRDVVGQTKQIQSIVRAIEEGKLPTAYLFAGPRGCGKTTAAFLLAKSVNCLNLQPGAEPCNECDVCQSIDDKNQIGVTYMSAAQIKGVEEVRSVVQQARLKTPIKKQVFILDEVQALSSKAFDSLLIPLEEEDMPAIFVLCTTEIEKVPDPILSRVQSRKFTFVPSNVLTPYIEHIASLEKLTLSEDDIDSIVKAGRGSVRDTLTKLEEFVSSGALATSSHDVNVVKSILVLNTAKAWEEVSKAEAEGVDCKDLAEIIFSDLRHLCVTLATGKTHVAPGSVEVIPYDKISSWGNKFGGRDKAVKLLIDAAEAIGDGVKSMTWGGDSRVHLDLAILKAVKALRGV